MIDTPTCRAALGVGVFAAGSQCRVLRPQRRRYSRKIGHCLTEGALDGTAGYANGPSAAAPRFWPDHFQLTFKIALKCCWRGPRRRRTGTIPGPAECDPT
jgi:hypothetical protein